MSSLMLRKTTSLLKPLLLVFSVFILFRGHNEPGGGFVGGLLAAAAFALQAISRGTAAARRALKIDPHLLLGTGLLVALAAGLPALWQDQPFLTGCWFRVEAPMLGPVELSTVLLFDAGVYLVVWGALTLMIFTLSEE